MKKYLFIGLITVSFFSCHKKQFRQSASKHSEYTLAEKIKHLHTPDEDYVLVVAHRGDWRNAPQNSLQAIQNSIDMGVDVVEVDVQKTKDGVLVLMHDKTIDNASDGSGLVSDFTLEEIKKFRLKNGLGRPTHHTIPTLEEAMLLAKGKILMNLDKCYDNFDEVYKVLKKTGTEKQVVMKGNVPVEQLKKEFGAYLSEIPFMPIVKLVDPHASQIVEDYSKAFRPIAYEFTLSDTSSTLLNSFKEIRKNGSKVWVNSLWASLNAGYEDDMAVANPDSIYGWYVKKGVNIIQTDRPQLLLNYLRSKGLHK